MNYLIAIGAILFLMVGWHVVQQASRWFAWKHPELGPYREEGGCGSSCGCGNKGSCRRDTSH